jgi:hypothetical protein
MLVVMFIIAYIRQYKNSKDNFDSKELFKYIDEYGFDEYSSNFLIETVVRPNSSSYTISDQCRETFMDLINTNPTIKYQYAKRLISL